MPLMPKRVKYRKSQRGKLKGNASRGNRVVFGDYGLQGAGTGAGSKAQAIEAGRVTVTHAVRGEGRLYIRVFPHKSITAIPAETRMGKGKGEPEYWATRWSSPAWCCSRSSWRALKPPPVNAWRVLRTKCLSAAGWCLGGLECKNDFEGAMKSFDYRGKMSAERTAKRLLRT